MIFSAFVSAASRSSVYAPVDRYFQPPSHTMNTIVPWSISLATLAAPASAAPDGDAGEHAALVHQPTGPLDRLAGPHDALAVEQLEAVPLLEHRRDVAVVEVAQPFDALAERRLDGDDLDRRVLFLEVPTGAHQRAARAETGDEVGDLGASRQISGPVPS